MTINSKINNLPSNYEAEMIPLVEQLFEKCIPQLQKCYEFCMNIQFPFGNVPNQDGDFDQVTFQLPLKKSLYESELQVITKIIDYELQPGQIHPEGAWHVEGMSHENIIATAVTVLRKDAFIEGGSLHFKRAFTGKEATEKIYYTVPQSRQKWVNAAIKNGLIELGHIQLQDLDTVIFPNSHVHQLSTMKNDSNDDFQVRRIIVFWLINPNKKIISTAHVHDLSNEKIGILEALDCRLKLMKERKVQKQDWNIRHISLCEH